PIFHVDLYRTTAGDADLAELALDEMLSEGVVLIEWADKASALPRPYWRIAIEAVGVRSRRIELERIV
ncbi:MAG TPA: tRNA (adenosine(37)-N6)-threonylcarbamoyltransferase complex ATPase subunit type 1 TsaE, partial [Phycisphaerae bacterium]|nr:tRNA (adenosine(37)-N6)-threonylcarbamoyltransferase complex ATPase subunit type 1 TsaE [Phycisphaerae bacterium]